jgi:hypothetical protein
MDRFTQVHTITIGSLIMCTLMVATVSSAWLAAVVLIPFALPATAASAAHNDLVEFELMTWPEVRDALA